MNAATPPVPPEIEDIQMVPRLTIRSEIGLTNAIEYSESLTANEWHTITNLVVTDNPYRFVDMDAPPSPRRFYRVRIVHEAQVPPTNLVYIAAGSFLMGDNFGDGATNERPVHSVTVSAFYLDPKEVTKGLWDQVYQWALQHGYSFDNSGSGKALDHPVHTVNWYDVVKWCNARSEKEGLTPCYYTNAAQTAVYRTAHVDVTNEGVAWEANGYRLPTEAEWEKAARGGLTGRRFPWGDTITHTDANYYSTSAFSYDVSATRGFHPDYDVNPMPYTSPVGAFAPNDYGLFDLAGNVWEWCWDAYSSTYYPVSPGLDPRGSNDSSHRVYRGGSWYLISPDGARCAYRNGYPPAMEGSTLGFRLVRSRP